MWRCVAAYCLEYGRQQFTNIQVEHAQLNHSNIDLLVTGLVNVFSTWVHVWGVALTDGNRKNRFCCRIMEESKLIAYIVYLPALPLYLFSLFLWCFKWHRSTWEYLAFISPQKCVFFLKVLLIKNLKIHQNLHVAELKLAKFPLTRELCFSIWNKSALVKASWVILSRDTPWSYVFVIRTLNKQRQSDTFAHWSNVKG